MVSMFSEDYNGYLGAEGFADNRIMLNHCTGDDKPIKFSDCVFQIMPQHNYTAHKALKKHRKKMAAKAAAEAEAAADEAKGKRGKTEEVDLDNEDEEGEKEKKPAVDFTMNKLLEQHENEKETNRLMVADQAGTPISYGMLVQVLHVKSQKWICMRPKLVAEQERSCSAMDLSAEGGTSGLYFKVESRYKFREQGAPVLKTDEIFLMNPKVEQYLHIAASGLPMQPSLREVNASQALRSRMKIVSFTEHDTESYKYMKGGDVIRLYHPESDTSLCVGHFNKYGFRIPQYIGFYGSEDIEKNDSMGLWEVEQIEPDKGGPCEYIQMGMPATYRFRNLATGVYLSGRMPDPNYPEDPEVGDEEEEEEEEDENGNPIVVDDAESVVAWELAVQDTTRQQDSLFSLETTAFSSSNFIEANAPVRVQHHRSGRFIHAGEAKQSKQDVFEGAVASKPTLGVEALDEHTLLLQTVDDAEVKDLYFVLGTMPTLEAYVTRLNNHYQKNVAEAPPPVDEYPTQIPGVHEEAAPEEVQEVQEADPEVEVDAVSKIKEEMAKAKKQGSASPTPVDIASSDGPLSSIEAGLIIKTLTELIFFVTKTESKDPVTCEGLPQRPRQKLLREQDFGSLLIRMVEAPFQGGEELGPYYLPDLLIGHPIIDISQLVYRLMKHMCKDYRRNEFYLAPHIDLFIQQSCLTGDDNDLYAEATISGLLSGNKELLEEKIDMKNIGLFVDLLLEQDKDARYVDLLTETCSCQGEAIASNQEALGELMLCARTSPRAVQELCIRTSLDKKGQPMIVFIDYRNGQPTALSEFLEDAEDGMAEYYTSLLGLFAEICFDRNYKGIKLIENLYRYEVVLKCMASDELPYDLRAKFTHLLLCLHLDREPQVVVSVPNFTRTDTHATPQMGFVEGESSRDFRDIKEFVTRYFAEMQPYCKAWEHDKNELSLKVLEVGRFLTAAGFYTAGKDVRNLVNPLVSCMDGTMDLTYPPEDARPDPKNILRYEQTEGTVPIMEGKVIMCDILLLLSNIRLDSRITDLLRVYASSHKAGQKEISSQDFSDIFIGGDMDLQTLSEKDVVAILLDLTMYKHDALVNVAFANLMHHFTQKHELIVASERVQLLTDPTLVDLHDQVKKDLRRLCSLVETEELWLGEIDENDCQGELLLILSTMLSHCEAPIDEEPEPGKKPRRKSLTQQAQEDMHEDNADDEDAGRRSSVTRGGRGSTTVAPARTVDIKASRELLRNLGAHHAIVEVLKIERLLTVEGGLDLLCVCHRFLQAFAEDSTANTEEIAGFMDLFLDQLASTDSTVVTAAAETLTVIGASELTKELVQACLNGKGHVMTPVPVINGKAMAQCSINLACLNLLKQCIMVDGKYNKRNQNMVMKVLMDPKRLEKGPIQHQWLYDKGAAKLFGNAADTALGSAFTPETLLLEASNIAIVELLCDCCMGRNGLAQAKSQGIFSLQDLATHMENLKKHYIVKRPLMFFTLRVYLEASHGIGEELAHSTLFKIFTTDIAYAVEDSVVDDEESEYLFDCLFPCIKSYFKEFATRAKGSEEQVEMARTILSHLVELFGCCRQSWQKGRVADIGRIMLRQERLFTNVIKNGEWQPRTHKIQVMYNFHNAEEDDPAEQVEEEEEEVKVPKTDFQIMMKRMQISKDILDQAELEFEELTSAFKNIEEMTEKAFLPPTRITFEELIKALVTLVDVNEFPLSLELSQAGVKLLRKCVEMENPDSTLPASEWESEDWEDFAEMIGEWQGKMDDLGCVQLIMNLVGQSPEIPIVMDAIDLGITLLLGGNETVQDSFYDSSRVKGASNFFRRLDELLIQSFDEMKGVGADPAELQMQAAEAARKADAGDEEADEEAEEEPFASEVEEEDDPFAGEDEDDGFDENKNATIVFRFMQLLCEGHNQKCQRMMQSQTAQHVSFDLVQRTLAILRLLCCEMSADLDEDRMEAACQALDTLTEVIQGPCPSAQKSLMEAKVLDVCTQIMADPFDLAFEDPDHPLIMDVKEKTITLLVSLLEGVSSKKTFLVFGENLEFPVLQKRMTYVYRKCMEDAELDPDSVCDSRKVPEDIYFGDLNEAFAIYMLMATLAVHSQPARAGINPQNYDDEGRVAVEFFTQNAGCIEIKWEENLERIYFPIPPICTYLTEASRQNVLWTVNRESPGEKMMDFFIFTDELKAEMEHLERMSSYRIISFLSNNFEFLKTCMLYLAWVINALLLVDMKTTSATSPGDSVPAMYAAVAFSTPWIEFTVYGLGLVQTFLCLFIAGGVMSTNGPLAVDNSWNTYIRLLGKPAEDDPEPEEGSVTMLLTYGPEMAGIFDGDAGFLAMVVYYCISFNYLMKDSVVVVHLSYFIMAALGVVVQPFILCYHLMDIVYCSEILKNVLRAVTFNGVQLLMTAFLVLIVIYYFTIIEFNLFRTYFFNEDFSELRACDTLMDCMLTTIREGLINGGGMGDYLQKPTIASKAEYITRFFFDLTYFVTVLIILLNIVFGIIIDTFSAMREMFESKLADMKTTCFICSIECYTFDRQGTPFDIHIKEEHNMWKYLYYMVYLKTKDASDYTGVESYVTALMEEEDVGFYPVNRSMCLDADEEEEDPFQVDVVAKFEHVAREFSFLKKTIMGMKGETSTMQATTVDFNKSVMAQVDKLANGMTGILSELNSAKDM